MGYNSPDVYSQPEKFGLKLVAEIDYSDKDYQFDTRAVWLHESGKLYTARDSGCSCPSPFEDYTSLEKLDIVNIVELERETQEKRSAQKVYVSAREVNEFLRKVRRLPKKANEPISKNMAAYSSHCVRVTTNHRGAFY